ncbi:MAG: dephospho-CoA kinase [Pseudomonadota bacterium]
MLSVGLTGGIASGKSLASSLFAQLGAYVIDADTVAREVVKPGREGHRRVIESFGRDMLRQDATLDREKLGALVFGNTARRNLLNELLHPLIIGSIQEEIARRGAAFPYSIIIADMPLLIECGMQHEFDRVVLVFTDREMQKERLMRRSNLDETGAEQRLCSQMPIGEKKIFAHYVIENTGSIAELEDNVTRTYGFLKKDLDAKQAVRGKP